MYILRIVHIYTEDSSHIGMWLAKAIARCLRSSYRSIQDLYPSQNNLRNQIEDPNLYKEIMNTWKRNVNEQIKKILFVIQERDFFERIWIRKKVLWASWVDIYSFDEWEYTVNVSYIWVIPSARKKWHATLLKNAIHNYVKQYLEDKEIIKLDITYDIHKENKASQALAKSE